MHLFYVPHISTNTQVYTLSKEESHHIVKVLRSKKGDTITLTDGQGNIYSAKVLEAHPKQCKLQVIEQKNVPPRSYRLHMAIAPTKNIFRFEWFLEKATEIGIEEITPIITTRSERKILKEERANSIIISAMKQSNKAYCPKLNPLTSFKELMTQYFEGQKYIAHCQTADLPYLKNKIKPNENTLILIGPEGDFSNEEVNIAVQSGYNEVSLSPYRLRTETAGIVACHTINLINT